MKGYKAFETGWKCKGFQYEIGQTYELPEWQKLKMCECGFHFCINPIDVFGYYPMNDDTLIAEVEALGDIQQEGTKYCTNKIRIIKEFTREELQKLIRDGSHNSGDCNSGSYNSGDCNSGDWNSGSHNSGGRNSGYYNSGSWNSGSRNSGSRNSGSYNSGSWNSGIFNTDEPMMRAFNKLTDIKFTDFVSQYFIDLCNRIFENALIDGDVERIKALPNFDPKVFKQITGMDMEDMK